MAIVNWESFPVLDSSDGNTKPYYRTHSIAWELKPWNDFDCYYVEYKFRDSFHVFPYNLWLPEDVLTKIKTGELKLFLVNFHESFPDSVEPIYTEIILKLDLPPENIVLGSGNPDMLIEIKRCAEKYSKPEIKLEWFLELEYSLWEQKTRRPEFQHRLNTLQIKPYAKSFVNFNRRWRMHRPTMVALLAANDLLDKGYVSFGRSDMSEGWDQAFLSILDWNQDDSIRQTLLANKDKICNLPELYVDTDDLVTNRALIENSADWFLENTYFSLVSETTFYTGNRVDSRGRFITEKTFKSIAQEHPFILITAPKTLPLLHQLGYKTFSPWINEEYDSETNDYRRLEKIVKEVERLSKLTESELNEFLIECKKICVHNYHNLMSKTRFAYPINY